MREKRALGTEGHHCLLTQGWVVTGFRGSASAIRGRHRAASLPEQPAVRAERSEQPEGLCSAALHWEPQHSGALLGTPTQWSPAGGAVTPQKWTVPEP